MNILTIDTAGPVTALAVSTEQRLIGESFLHTEQQHSERLLPLIEALLKACGLRPADLDLVGAACGPGSFTGIRVGIATAQGMAQALNIPALGLGALDIVSWAGWGRPGDIMVLADARKNEWYAARYRWREEKEPGGGGRWRREVLEAPRVLAERDLAAQLAAWPAPVWLAGEGAERAGRLAGGAARALPGAAALTRGAYAARETREILAAGGLSAVAAQAADGRRWQIEPYYIRLSAAEARRQAGGADEPAAASAPPGLRDE
ncbi:MAG: tRNA (adenosine(37)-N6)-threonylcarbamoyltransferase complex dimerization subunit type 1 TsaB [Gracilibacteraceae bacterium]|jgi:tRNA threonylcarbamoyladenosine biosynthesis protein TsaB|nr:tRNA (adenosine(37)-N6)-threonylcarbamoyltransferase complex dimerization subunit type 1 TsaB [Gracilibacteraceae bacterium]